MHFPFYLRIEQNEKAARMSDTETVTTAQKVAKWFEDNVYKKFGSWWSNDSDIFWVNGFGKLQARLSFRDAASLCSSKNRKHRRTTV